MYYEYKTLPLYGDELDNSCEGLIDKLNEIGKSGWELISILSQNGLGSSPHNIFGITQRQFLVLKRPVAQEVK